MVPIQIGRPEACLAPMLRGIEHIVKFFWNSRGRWMHPLEFWDPNMNLFCCYPVRCHRHAKVDWFPIGGGLLNVLIRAVCRNIFPITVLLPMIDFGCRSRDKVGLSSAAKTMARCNPLAKLYKSCNQTRAGGYLMA